MPRSTIIASSAALCVSAVLALGVAAARKPRGAADLTSGKIKLQSAGALAFGPNGVLFVADNAGGAVAAIETGDRDKVGSAKINVQGVDARIAALVGVSPNQIVINDVKVNPISKNAYVSASRGRGPNAAPLIVRVDPAGNVSNVPLNDAKGTSIKLVDAAPDSGPAPGYPAFGLPLRMLTITDMHYVDGNLLVAGLSNEEWNSALRSIPYPFKNAQKGATIQIWHASRGAYETQAPVRTFVPYTIAGKDYILAAYTCTPLVKIPVSDLKPGAQVSGATIADLGSGSQPLDMVPYKKDGHDYILIANSSRGVMKLKADRLDSYEAIDSPTVPNPPTNIAGVPYETIASLKGVQHLTRLDENDALLLIGTFTGDAAAPGPPAGPISLQTIQLP